MKVVVGDGTRRARRASRRSTRSSCRPRSPRCPGRCVEQLDADGRLVQPIGPGGSEDVVLFERAARGSSQPDDHGRPLRPRSRPTRLSGVKAAASPATRCSDGASPSALAATDALARRSGVAALIADRRPLRPQSRVLRLRTRTRPDPSPASRSSSAHRRRRPSARRARRRLRHARQQPRAGLRRGGAPRHASSICGGGHRRAGAGPDVERAAPARLECGRRRLGVLAVADHPGFASCRSPTGDRMGRPPPGGSGLARRGYATSTRTPSSSRRTGART